MDELARIRSLIYEVRGVKIMLDKDLAELYHVTTGNLNKAVKRNIRRFPSDFMFQLTKDEWDSLRFQFGIIENGRGKYTKYLPYAFTEQGLAMLSGVLKSDIAIDVNISIMRAFVELRHLTQTSATNYLELKKEIEAVRDEVNDILADQNDINESTRAQLDAISTALVELQSSRSQNATIKKRRPIGFIQPKDEEDS